MPAGSRAARRARNVASSAVVRDRWSHADFAVPMPCSALMLASVVGDQLQDGSVDVVVIDGAEYVHVEIAVTKMSEYDCSSIGRPFSNDVADSGVERSECCCRQRDVEFVRHAELADGLGDRLPESPQSFRAWPIGRDSHVQIVTPRHETFSQLVDRIRGG